MDYQIFLVRQAASGRTPWGGLRILRILDHGVSVSSLATPNAAPTEYKFEHVSKVLAGDDDQNELRLEVVDSSKSGFGTETVRLSCEARTSLVTALFNRLDDLNGIGMWMLLWAFELFACWRTFSSSQSDWLCHVFWYCIRD